MLRGKSQLGNGKPPGSTVISLWFVVCWCLLSLCLQEKSGNIEFGFEFELDLQLDSKLDLELEFEFHIFHSDSHEFCKSLHGPRPLEWTISSY